MKKLQDERVTTNDHLSSKYQQLKLINGEFSSSDAKEILLQLFSDKIKYHQIRYIGKLERFGEIDNVSAKRLPELKQQVQNIFDIFQDENIQNASIKIQATIHIEIVE